MRLHLNGFPFSLISKPKELFFILVIKQIGLPLLARPILLITRMITDGVGLHSVLLPFHYVTCMKVYNANSNLTGLDT